MGSSVMLRRNEHFRFVGFAEKLKGSAFWINELLVMLLLLTCNIIMLIHGIKLSQMFYTWRFGSMFTVSKIWLWLCIPLSAGAGVLYMIETILRFFVDPSTRKVVNEADKLLEDN